MPERCEWSPSRLTLRQNSTMASGVVMVVVLVLFSLWQTVEGGSLRLVFGSLAIAVLTYLMMIAPRLTLRDEGVIVHNPWRVVRIPWGRLDYVGSGWTLALSAEDERYEAFGITSQATFRSAARRGQGDSLSPGTGEGLTGRVTPGRAAAVIEQAQQEWLDGLTGTPGVMGEGEHASQRWDPIALGLTALMIAFAVLAVLA